MVVTTATADKTKRANTFFISVSLFGDKVTDKMLFGHRKSFEVNNIKLLIVSGLRSKLLHRAQMMLFRYRMKMINWIINHIFVMQLFVSIK